jgi:hypothetical protein
MSKLKHTPGPWDFMYSSRFKVNVYSESTHATVCNLKKTDRDVTDARLIAAAPEMIEALIELWIAMDLYLSNESSSSDKEFPLTKTIIEKATGQKIEELI